MAEPQLGEVDKDLFLEAIRQYRCLWDVNSSSYKERNAKINAWKELASTFGHAVPYLQKTLKNLKDTLKKCLDRRKALTRSGASASSLPECKYFQQMAFLHEKSGNLPTVSNIMANVGEAATECGLPSQSNIIIATSNTTEPNPYLQQQVSVSPTGSVIKADCQLSSKNALPSTSAPAKKLSTSQKRKALAAEMDDENGFFVNELKKIDNAIYSCIENNKEECEDMLFCKSLVPQLKGLPLKKKRLAKIKVSQLLFDIDFDESI